MVDFSTISPHLQIKISPKAKRLALRLDGRARKVNLVIPKRASLKKAYEFAEQHQDWIADKIGNLPRPIPFENGAKIPVFGKIKTLRIELTGQKTIGILDTCDSIIIKSNHMDVSPRLMRHLKQSAKSGLEKMANEKAQQLGRHLTKFIVRDMKSRWGSCSTDGRMTLSWRLIFAPPEAIDYVISHEAAHLKHPNHGSEFWKLCEKLSINFQAGHDWMKANGSSLGRYGENNSLS